MNKRIDETNEEMRKGFADVNKRFANMDRRFESIDGRFEKIDRRFESINKRFADIENIIIGQSQLREINIRELEKRIDSRLKVANL